MPPPPWPPGPPGTRLGAPGPQSPPLIVTADLDEGAFDGFQDLRQAHAAAHRNLVPAHLTLFHALPGASRRSSRPGPVERPSGLSMDINSGEDHQAALMVIKPDWRRRA